MDIDFDGVPSDPLYYEHIQPGYLHHVGKFKKFTRLKNRRKYDNIYGEYVLKHGDLAEGQFGLTIPNRDAYYKGLSKFCRAQTLDYDHDAFAFAEACVYKHFYQYCKDSKIISVEDAVKRLELSTSCGPPHSTLYKTKREIPFDDFVRMGKEAVEHLQEDDFYFLTGTSMKEEVRDIERINLNKIRLFNPQSADACVATNVYCGDFNDKFTDCCLKTMSCVGISPFNGGWHQLYCRMNDTTKPNKGGYDYANWDATTMTRLMFMNCRFRFLCYREEDRTYHTWVAICNAYKSIIFSIVVLPDGSLEYKPGGNPSGVANTVVDNTLMNAFVVFYNWYRLAPEVDRTYERCLEELFAILYGDDNSDEVSNYAYKFYNPLNLISSCATLGLVLEPDSMLPLTIDQLTFLKSDFRHFINGICIYHVDPTKSFESLKWSENPDDPIYALVRACGMRIVTWSDEKARSYIDAYIQMIINKFDKNYIGNKDWNSAKCGYHSDQYLMKLYTGFESNFPKAYACVLAYIKNWCECKEQKDIHTSGVKIDEEGNIDTDFNLKDFLQVVMVAQSKSRRRQPTLDYMSVEHTGCKKNCRKCRRAKKTGILEFVMEMQSAKVCFPSCCVDDKSSAGLLRTHILFNSRMEEIISVQMVLQAKTKRKGKEKVVVTEKVVPLPQRPKRIRVVEKVVVKTNPRQARGYDNAMLPLHRGGFQRRDKLGLAVTKPIKKKGRRINAFTKYMSAMVDPERFGVGLRLPDEFTGETAAFMSKINLIIPLYSNGPGPGGGYDFNGASNFPGGGFSILCTPTFETPFRFMKEFNNLAGEQYEVVVDKQTDRAGFFDLDGAMATEAELNKELVLEAGPGGARGSPSNIVGMLNLGNPDPAVTVPMFLNQCADTTYFYGMSLNLNSATVVISGNTDVATSTDPTGVLVFQAVNTTGVVSTANASFIVLSTGIRIGQFTVAMPIGGGSGIPLDCRGDAMIGFRAYVGANALGIQSINFSSLAIKILYSNPEPQLNYIPKQIPGFQQAATLYNRFRVNSMSLLTSYLGSDLQNGGMIGAKLCSGGTPAIQEQNTNTTGFSWTLTGLTDTSESYGVAPIKDGAYTYWLPKDERDLHLNDRSWDGFRSAQIVHIGAVAPTVGTTAVYPSNVIRCRFIVCYECTTATTIVPVMNTPCNPKLLEQLKKAIDNKDIPTSTANDLHEEIRKWIGLPFDIVQDNLPKVTSIMDKAGPLIKMLGFML